MMATVKPPAWFWMVVILLLVWNLIGGVICIQQFRLGADAMGPADAYQRALVARLPAWHRWDFAVTEVLAIGGSLALLGRRRGALPLAVLAVVGIALQFGYLFAATDVIAHEGFAKAAGLPIVIIVIALFQVTLARTAVRRGWIG